MVEHHGKSKCCHQHQTNNSDQTKNIVTGNNLYACPMHPDIVQDTPVCVPFVVWL